MQIIVISDMSYMKVKIVIGFLTALICFSLVLNTHTEAQITTTYFVDCINGNDANTGTSQQNAWQTISKANSAPLQPGDTLRFKRGCTFTSRLEAAWDGTEANPITIGAYGSGDKPLIQTDTNGTANIRITGSYQIVENIRTTMLVDPNPDPITGDIRDFEELCTDTDGQSTQSAVSDGWWVGFAILGHHNILRNSEAFGTKPDNGLSLGVNLTIASHHNKVLNNHIHDVHALWRIFQPGSPGTMITGAQGD